MLSYRAALRRLAEEKELPRLFLLCGDEALAKEFGRALKEELERRGEAVDYFAWEEGEEGEALARALFAPPCGLTRRVVFVPPRPLARFRLTFPPFLSGVVRAGRAEEAGEALLEAATRDGWVVDCSRPRGEEFLAWAAAEAAALGKEIAPAAAEYLRYLSGEDAGLARQELAKVALYLGAEKRITVAALKEVGSRTAGRTAFELVDAVAGQKEKQAVEILAELRLRGQPPALLASLLARHFLLLWEASFLRAAGAGPEEVAHSLKVHPYVAKKLWRQGGKFGPARTEKVLKVLLALDRQLKKGAGDPFLLLEAAVWEILGLLK